MLPHALIITSGIGGEEARLAPGIVTAMQSLNAMGVATRLEPRDILYDPVRLERYSILILSTFPGQHDADRKYSLSYMSDEELDNLRQFVGKGGWLIMGDNIGRNYPDGTDRITLFEQLTADNWGLAECLGTAMAESNLAGYRPESKIQGDLDMDFSSSEESVIRDDMWVLVPDGATGSEIETLASLTGPGPSVPAVFRNRLGKGAVYFLATTGFLQPAGEGGFWSIDQIDRFYRYVVDDYIRSGGIKAQLNPWPGGAGSAFSVSLNADGNVEQFTRMFKFLKDEEVVPTVFVSGGVDQEIRQYLRDERVPLGSVGYSYLRYDEMSFPAAVEDILRNESSWDTDFTGFRFPFTQPGFFGLMALKEQRYSYESSIGANNIDFIHGSVVPHNLVISSDGFYSATEILEIAPTYHDDYFFLSSTDQDPAPDSLTLAEDILIYASYLQDYWNSAVKPYGGMMVFLGHPRYTAYNDATLASLSALIGEVKQDQAWITTLEEAADFRRELEAMRFFSVPGEQGFAIRVEAADNAHLEGVGLKVAGVVASAAARQGKTELSTTTQGTLVTFDAFDGQEVTITLE